MRLTASDIYGYYRPSPCDLRVYLQAKGEPQAEPSPYDEVIRKLGDRHEQAHLATLQPVVDLSQGSQPERVASTLQAIRECTPVIYHGLFSAQTKIAGQDCEIIGEPDFLILTDKGCVIRDSKISRRITENEHPDIILQLGLYGWLFKKATGKPSAALHVHAGTDEIVTVPFDQGKAALAALEIIVAAKALPVAPYSPVGWSRCDGCGYRSRCWTLATEAHDSAIIEGIDQGLATVLHQQGITTYEDLLASYTVDTLAEVQKPHDQKFQRVGKRSASILRMARATASGKEILIHRPEIPAFLSYVMFDLEGLPPQLDELEKAYLWGMQVYGEDKSEYMPAVAGFGEEGDRQGWFDFLSKAEAILSEFGDIPFVHWASYEKTKIDLYVKRYGDPDGIAASVRANLLDLLPITKKSIALPLPSYSLKVVEQYVGFKRTQDEYGGNWSMARYIEATETQDEALRKQVMDQILLYNKEDLAATWAVLRWLRCRDFAGHNDKGEHNYEHR